MHNAGCRYSDQFVAVMFEAVLKFALMNRLHRLNIEPILCKRVCHPSRTPAKITNRVHHITDPIGHSLILSVMTGFSVLNILENIS